MSDGSAPTTWVLQRPCAWSPARTWRCWAGAAALGAVPGLAFGWLGYPLITAYTALVFAAYALALLVYGWHARDGETLVLEGDSLTLEQRVGARRRCARFDAAAVRLGRRAGDGAIELRVRGRLAAVLGLQVHEARRAQVAGDLARALARSSGG